ncbi:MAG: hypothetical protein ACREFC_04220, partial [Stellaceae bacterium]
FHTYHFEPWRGIGDKIPAIGQEVVDGIGDFVRTCERIDFARRLTLFYKPHLNYALRRGGGVERADPDDLVCFLPRGEKEERFGRAAMQHVAADSAHEIQLHIHHEYYTATKSHTEPAAVEWFAGPHGHRLDAARLELAIRLNREIIARETGRFPDRWFFIHGQWGLNGSDDSSCTITDEIDVLMRNGCLGDFTFPAGRPAVNPRIQAPYFCLPFDAPKGYDRAEAEPEIAAGNSAAALRKFFVWACAASSLQCSLDYMSASSRKHLENTEKAARSLIEGSYRAGRSLFVKTHAHSMHSFYFENARLPVFPHQYPATQTLFSVIFDAAARAGVDVRFATAAEAYASLIGDQAKPQIDLVAAYLRPSGPLRALTSGGNNRARQPSSRPAAPSNGERGGLSRLLSAWGRRSGHRE